MAIEGLSEERLHDAGIRDPVRARRLIETLAGQGVTDDMVEEFGPALLAALSRSPDPDRALTNLHRWLGSVTSRYTQFRALSTHPVFLDAFLSVCGTSQFFSDILARNPEYMEILANPGVRSGARTAAEMYAELSAFVDSIRQTELKLEAMRRFRQREVLRIGARDILGIADMPSTAREFSSLADACVQKCLEIGVAEISTRAGSAPPALAVIGMGKLGGEELNYSSDIDLMFVAEELSGDSAVPAPAVKLAEFIVSALSKNLQNGHLFRVDVRLRPEGRFGALVRTLASYRAYYESWAEPWELQALIKARPIAGDPHLGEAFIRMITPFVYRRAVTVEFLDDLRRNKRAIENKAELEGQARTNVKIGFGGIRDIEFLVQSLQLRLGGRNPLLRTPNTLEAIARLRHAGILDEQDTAELTEDYQFLRNIEHRLQILYELQTQSMPTDPEERRLLARRLGYSDAEAFDAEYAARTARVREKLQRLFYEEAAPPPRAPVGELLQSSDSAQARARVADILRRRGFYDPEQAANLLAGAAAGGAYGLANPDARRHLIELADRLVAACARTGDPDAALAGIELLAVATPSRAELYRALLEGEELLERLCALGAGSPPSIQLLARRLEWLDLLVSEEVLDPAPKARVALQEELAERIPISRKVDNEAFWTALSSFIQRERLRITARDLWGEIPVRQVGHELTTLAEVVIEAILARAKAATPGRPGSRQEDAAGPAMAVIGMGRLGGRELGYGSDWDVLFVYDETEAGSFAAVNRVAEWILAAGQELRTRGAPVEIDARLRPEGRFGQLARTVPEYEAYYGESALTWERQALTRARPIAGNPELGAAFVTAAHRAIYSSPISEQAAAEIAAMKERIERERLKLEERETDLKLGHGGLSDVEFLTQLGQLRHGSESLRVRTPETVEALLALSTTGFLRAPEARRLADAWLFLSAVRNRLYLLSGVSTDALPSDPRRLRAVAAGLGIPDTSRASAEETLRLKVREHMRETRRMFERVFRKPPH